MCGVIPMCHKGDRVMMVYVKHRLKSSAKVQRYALSNDASDIVIICCISLFVFRVQICSDCGSVYAFYAFV